MQLKVLVDILTPKQCMLFSKLSERLEREGHKVLRITRRYREVLQLLRLKGVEAKVIGKHGGGTLAGKLKASTERTLKLSSLIQQWEPDVAVSFSSPETTRAAFGLGVPHFCINDSPHAQAVARLTIPLSEILLTPKMISKKAWTKFGISAEKITQYNALDPWAWLKDFRPDKNVLKQLGLDKSKPVITFRTEEAFAAYLLGKTTKKTVITPLIERFLETSRDFQVIVVPRYESQVATLKKALGEKAVVCEFGVDGPSLLSFTSVFVGAGGTMTAEAALLGVPTLSYYPGKPFLIEEYLVRKGLVTRETAAEKVFNKVMKLLQNLELAKIKQKEKARKLTHGFEDPTKVIANTIEKVALRQ